MVILSENALIDVAKKAREKDKTVAVCNGTFDLLHAGHLFLFEQAKQKGDILIVLINSDSSVKKYKGENRPIIDEGSRARLVDSLKTVDYVYIFSDENPVRLLELIKPDYYFSGPDYGKNCLGAEAIERNGGQVMAASRDDSAMSTSKIIEKIKTSIEPETKAVFLDRDGVINFDSGYVGKKEDFKIIPGALETIKKLGDNDFLLFIISNQSGVGRGYFEEKDVTETTSHLLNEIESAGGKVEKVHYCFHTPEDDCDCRKPNPKILLDLSKEYNIVLKDSYFVSDTKDDISMAKKLNIKTVWIDTNLDHPKNKIEVSPDFTARSLIEASKFILK